MKSIEKKLNEKNEKLKELNDKLYIFYVDMLNTFNYLGKPKLFDYFLKRLNILERKYYDII